MIPTDTTDKTETWVCHTCSSTNAGWRLRCECCGMLVRSSTSWGPPLPQQWQQPPPTPPKKRSGVKRALAVVSCVMVGCVGLGAAGVGILAFQNAQERRQTEERVDEYLDGEGAKEFFAADSQFRATFPSLPERSTEPTDADAVASEVTFYTSDLDSKAFSVGTFDLPPGSTFDLNLSVNAAAAAVDGYVESATPTTWQGFDAIEALISEAEGLNVRLLVVLTPARVYMVQVIGIDDPAVEYETFKASFEITL